MEIPHTLKIALYGYLEVSGVVFWLGYEQWANMGLLNLANEVLIY
jgi:hypothetical protein